MKPDQPFDALWEAYVFKVATLLIDSASPNDQTKMIDLVSKASQCSDRNNNIKKQHRYSVHEALISSPSEQLERQWGEALKNPLNAQRIRVKSRRLLLRRSFLLNQQQIESTQICIDRMRCLIERSQRTKHTTSLQSPLLSHYQEIQGRYMAYLVKLKIAMDEHVSRLNR